MADLCAICHQPHARNTPHVWPQEVQSAIPITPDGLDRVLNDQAESDSYMAYKYELAEKREAERVADGIRHAQEREAWRQAQGASDIFDPECPCCVERKRRMSKGGRPKKAKDA